MLAKSLLLTGMLAVTAGDSFAATDEEARAALEKWLAASSKVKSVEARFDQLRQLKSVRKPLRREGQVWMEKPGSFRWQIGPGPDLLVQRDGEGSLWVLDGKDKKARVWNKAALEAQEKDGKGQGFAMIQSMQSISLKEFEEQFKIRGGEPDATNPDVWAFDLGLKDNKAALFVIKVTLKGNLKDGSLHLMTMHMRDGSSMTTAITSYKLNMPIADSVFKVDTTGYAIEKE
ncbi:MAG: outer membrane lipoprotein carrier protein LolA [Verrucomicrobium sp.]